MTALNKDHTCIYLVLVCYLHRDRVTSTRCMGLTTDTNHKSTRTLCTTYANYWHGRSVTIFVLVLY